MKQYFVYILSSKRNGTLYTGVTSNIIKRIWEHKNNIIAGFTNEHTIHNLIYYEVYNDSVQAISREKNLKRWKRKWKLKLIEVFNPTWEDLYKNIV